MSYFLKTSGGGSSAPVTDQAWQLFFRLPAVLEVVYRPDVACCRSPYLWLKATFWIFRLLNCGVRGCAWCLVPWPETRHCPRTQRWGLEFLFDIDTVTNTQYLEKVPSGGLSLWRSLRLPIMISEDLQRQASQFSKTINTIFIDS